MTLRSALRSSVAAACIVATAAPAGWAAAPAARGPTPQKAPLKPEAKANPEKGPAQAAPLDIRIGRGPDFSRVEFHWKGGAKAASRRDGQTLTLRFDRQATPNLADLKVAPPKWLKSVSSKPVAGGVEIALTLADGADAKVGADGGVTYVNMFEKAAEAPEPEPIHVETEAAPKRADPTPPGGLLRAASTRVGKGAELTFRWAAPAGAAVFRRGGSLWVVFDTPATIDLSALPKDGSLYSKAEASRGEGYSAVRLRVDPNTTVAARAEGSTWIIALGTGEAGRPPGLVDINRDLESARPGLTAVVAGATKAVWVNDPAVGDKLAVVTALGPPKAVPMRREFVDMAMLGTLQGLAVESYAEGLSVDTAGDIVRLGKPGGLVLSPASASNVRLDGDLGAPQPAAMPGLIDPDWGKTGPGGFLKRYASLMEAAAMESGEGDGDTVNARMALARFLIGEGLAHEAIGVLNTAMKARESLGSDGEFRGLRGMARMMAGRPKEAELDFSTSILADDPSTALWRGLIAVQNGDWNDAKQKFAQGRPALELATPIWRARFARAAAEAAMNLGDFPAAGEAIGLALSQDVSAEEQLQTRLVQARLMQAMGDTNRALAVFEAISRAAMEEVATPARLHATQIRLDRGDMSPADAAGVYDSLRYRWRGDATEIETIRALGDLYRRQGRYREALEVLRSAGQRLPDVPQAVDLQADLGAAFRALFLEGQADGLQPIQALALFYDFKELTPIGAEGDQMVRNLVRRLVDVDLLPQAADLLKYQVENRLDGAARAQVATDLALIYLMDRKPESALAVINGTRTTLLTPALNAERRVVTARALVGLGRLDAADEMIEQDKTPEAQSVRAEIAWKAREWVKSGNLYERGLGERWKNSAVLSADEEARLMRAAIAYSLGDDDGSLARLRQRWSGFVDAARNPEGLRVALSGVAPTGDFSRITTDNETFAGWVGRMKQRFREAPKGQVASAAPAKDAPKQG